MKISEIFTSIQGEGRYTGIPMLFIRTSGCTQKCSFCDTKYHINGKETSLKELIEIIRNSKVDIVCWTGGEPLLWREQIRYIIDETPEKWHHIETNGDLLQYKDFDVFQYLGISPKTYMTAEKVHKMLQKVDTGNFDIKVVTDLENTGKRLLKFATILMPLTTYSRQDKVISKRVWKYCVENNIKFTGRLQSYLFGKKKGV